ncbi:transcriptional regulator [Thioclava sp. SK-1]|uniref:helix-turn-helix transcriptional regulator n=1 Tax=Thioclava sp. SK-1 TaxID=1889770 RepID=UPI0008241E16|nr:YafY family protein [Thioclava sp. SK-1]OCX65945.1 transcriptional regulator [Thioclava sp. SK-1]
MAKSDRLLRVLNALRHYRPPVTAELLAQATGVSRRTLYRDIQALRAAGALIDGEAGVGYFLTEDPALPPQNLTRLEIEALTLGLAELRHLGDPELALAGESALAKITATLGQSRAQHAAHAIVSSYRFKTNLPDSAADMTLLRHACWEETSLNIHYTDRNGASTQREIYPLSIVYLDHKRMLLAWCCLRQEFRKFIVARIQSAVAGTSSFRPRRVALLRDYLNTMRPTRANDPSHR